MTKTQTNILEDAQDIVVVGHPEADRHVFAAKPSLRFMEEAFRRSLSNPADRNFSGFNGHWQFDDKKGITGSSTYLALRFDKMALRPLGLWIPNLLEARELEAREKLGNNVYRDYGITVFNDEEPNKTLSQSLVSQARQARLKLPLVVPFRVLDYAVGKKGIDVSFVDAPRRIISSDKAVKQIASLDYKGDSGVCALLRYWGGGWSANWEDLAHSSTASLVDWICGEATRKDLDQARDALTERNYEMKIRALEKEQDAEKARFRRWKRTGRRKS